MIGSQTRRTNWHDDAVHLTKESEIRASFAPLLKGQLDPQEMNRQDDRGDGRG